MASGRAAQAAAYGRLAELGLVIDGYETERHELDWSPCGFRRVRPPRWLHSLFVVESGRRART